MTFFGPKWESIMVDHSTTIQKKYLNTLLNSFVLPKTFRCLVYARRKAVQTFKFTLSSDKREPLFVRLVTGLSIKFIHCASVVAKKSKHQEGHFLFSISVGPMLNVKCKTKET